MQKTKPFEQLTYSDDFMFCKVMSSDPILCKDVIELCLGQSIGNINQLKAQNTIKALSDGKGVRLDVLASDDQNRNIDLEMQNSNENIHLRSRYYLCMMDIHDLHAGDDYKQLKDNYVIFIMPFNIFPESGRHRYTLQYKVLEEPELDLNFRQTIIYLCADGIRDDISEGLRAYLHYVRTNEATNDLTHRLEEALMAAKNNEEWGMEYYHFYDKIEEAKDIARKEGWKEGRKEERANTERERARADLEAQRADAAEKKILELEQKLAALSGAK